MRKSKCKVCGRVNDYKTGPCRKCGFNPYKPWYIRINLFYMVRDAEIATAKTQYAMFKLHRDDKEEKI